MKHIATLFLSLLIGTIAHAQVFQDHTRVRRLDSSALPQFQNATVCPSGSVLSGGVCTPLIQNQGGGGTACGMVRYQALAYNVGGIGYGYGQSGVQSVVACNGASPAYSVISSPENRHYPTISLNCPSGYGRTVYSADWVPDTNADHGQHNRWFITQVCVKNQ